MSRCPACGREESAVTAIVYPNAHPGQAPTVGTDVAPARVTATE